MMKNKNKNKLISKKFFKRAVFFNISVLNFKAVELEIKKEAKEKGYDPNKINYDYSVLVDKTIKKFEHKCFKCGFTPKEGSKNTLTIDAVNNLEYYNVLAPENSVCLCVECKVLRMKGDTKKKIPNFASAKTFFTKEQQKKLLKDFGIEEIINPSENENRNKNYQLSKLFNEMYEYLKANTELLKYNRTPFANSNVIEKISARLYAGIRNKQLESFSKFKNTIDSAYKVDIGK